MSEKKKYRYHEAVAYGFARHENAPTHVVYVEARPFFSLGNPHWQVSVIVGPHTRHPNWLSEMFGAPPKHIPSIEREYILDADPDDHAQYTKKKQRSSTKGTLQ